MKKFFKKVWRGIKKIYTFIKWISVRKSRRQYEVVEAAMPTLIGMKCIGGTPVSGRNCIFAGNRSGHRTIQPILVRKLKKNYITIHTKTDIITAKRIR